MTYFITALALGFLGSFHCVGMCGPIALALPVHHKAPLLKHALIVLYNLGRVITYSVLGLVAGTVGKSFALAGFQQGVSIALGIILIAGVFLPFKNSLLGYGFFLSIKTGLSRLFIKSSKPALFTIGLLNGFLPCGFVYVGITAAVASSDILQGAWFMCAFGLGTIPMMYLLPLTGGAVSLPLRNKMRKTTPVIITLMALFFIVRGLNLGIPYVSPRISNESNSAVPCHSSLTGPDHKNLIKCRISTANTASK
jgi:sulfite exporter TauE/SafE